MLGGKIKEIRTARKLSQVDLAKILCVTKQSISNWENENIQPSIEMLVRIADALNVTTDYLLSRDDKTYLEVSGLSKSEFQHIQLIISDLQNRSHD